MSHSPVMSDSRTLNVPSHDKVTNPHQLLGGVLGGVVGGVGSALGDQNASGGQEGVLFDPPVSQQGALCDPADSLSKAQGGDNAKFNIRLEMSCEGLPPAGPLDELQVSLQQ
ncbi:unnamed protein product [Boreogadus saida]